MAEGSLRNLPQIDRVLGWPAVASLLEEHPRGEVVRALRAHLESIRKEVLEGGMAESDLAARTAEAAVAEGLRRGLAARARRAYCRVINATGILLHTGLGRAVLAPQARVALAESLSGFSIVEVDRSSGERNEREAALRELLRELTGAESGSVVNNNAAATLLILAALARGGEVILSRGQMVEIGGSFRIPEILEESGARLVEVGTTNRTYIDDYRRALTPETALILSVHTSNYEIRGFARHTPLEELVALGRDHRVPVVSDLGSGCFVDLSPHGLRREPLVRDSVEAGADIVCFSGDKLLGGPQAGIIVGRAELVRRCRHHPLYRTLRVDKSTLILLEATLQLYRDPSAAVRELPIYRMLTAREDEVRSRVEAFRESLGPLGAASTDIVETTAEAGSGSLPAQEIPSWGLAVSAERVPADDLTRSLRNATPPVFGRIHQGRVVLDFRTVFPEDEAFLRAALRDALQPEDSPRGEMLEHPPRR